MLIQVPGLVFEPETHVYTLDGVEVDSVTKILKENGLSIDYSEVDPVVLAAAGHRGSQVHHGVALFERPELGDWEQETEERFLPYIECYIRWRELARWRPVYVEQQVICRQYDYVGTFDGWGTLFGVPALPDIKTRDLDEADGYQTAAYLAAWISTFEEVTGQVAPKELYETQRFGLRLFNDGTKAHLEPFKKPTDLDYFRSAAVCSAIRRRLGRPSPFLNEKEKQLWAQQRQTFPTSRTRRMDHRSATRLRHTA